MALLRYLTHPEVTVEPEVPIPQWGLNPRGRARAEAMLAQPWVAGIGRIVSSDEVKARELATVLGDHLGIEIEVREDTGENDRTATGFLPPSEFEDVADRFFAEPDRSVRGWERAVDAQARIVAALADLLVAGDTDVVVVGHGGVGTLLACALAGVPIDRRHDQPGQGHYFTVDLATSSLLHGWRRIDDLEQLDDLEAG